MSSSWSEQARELSGQADATLPRRSHACGTIRRPWPPCAASARVTRPRAAADIAGLLAEIAVVAIGWRESPAPAYSHGHQAVLTDRDLAPVSLSG